MNNVERLHDSDLKIRLGKNTRATSGGEGAWRTIHWILGSLVLALGLINISLGVFLAVLPLPVWVVWYIYMGILIIIILILEIRAFLIRRGVGQEGSWKVPGKKIDVKVF